MTETFTGVLTTPAETSPYLHVYLNDTFSIYHTKRRGRTSEKWSGLQGEAGDAIDLSPSTDQSGAACKERCFSQVRLCFDPLWQLQAEFVLSPSKLLNLTHRYKLVHISGKTLSPRKWVLFVSLSVTASGRYLFKYTAAEKIKKWPLEIRWCRCGMFPSAFWGFATRPRGGRRSVDSPCVLMRFIVWTHSHVVVKQINPITNPPKQGIFTSIRRKNPTYKW